MKKIVTLALIMSIIVGFNACKKDTSFKEVKNNDPTEQKILNFKAKLQNPDKNNETMSIDSAVWYIEAALNYDYCDTSKATIGIDSFFVNVQVNEDGTFNFTEIVNAYNQLNTDLQDYIGENTMMLADIEFANNNNKSNEQTVKMTVVKTNGSLQSWYFGPDDYWYLAELNGKCDGTNIGYDASTETNRKANYSLSRPNGDAYLTDIETNYLMQHYIQGGEYKCCSPDELNDALNNGKIFASEHKPANKDIIDYHFMLDQAVKSYYALTNTPVYGIWHITNPGEEQ